MINFFTRPLNDLELFMAGIATGLTISLFTVAFIVEFVNK